MKKISIIIPVYYNANSLAMLFSELLKVEQQLLAMQVASEWIFVDDGSGDHSWQCLLAIKQQRPDVKLVKLTRNFGAISACKAGYQFVTGDCFVVLAADLQDPPALLVELVGKWLAGYKFVVAERTGRKDPFLKKLYATLFYKILRVMVLNTYPKHGFDMFLLDSSFLPHFKNSSKGTNPSLFALWLGAKPEYIYYQRQQREGGGKSRWTFSKNITFFLDSILGFSVLPIRTISVIGLLVSFASFGYGLLIFVNTLLGYVQTKGYASTIVLITFLLGLIILMLGIIGEYILRIFYESNVHIQYVIDEIH